MITSEAIGNGLTSHRSGAAPVRQRESSRTPIPAGGIEGHPRHCAAAEFSGRVRSVVGARSISFASAQARKLIHCAAPPLPLASASMGRERDPKATGSSSPHAVFVLTEAQLKERQVSEQSSSGRLFQGFGPCRRCLFQWKRAGNGQSCQGVDCAHLNLYFED